MRRRRLLLYVIGSTVDNEYERMCFTYANQDSYSAANQYANQDTYSYTDTHPTADDYPASYCYATGGKYIAADRHYPSQCYRNTYQGTYRS